MSRSDPSASPEFWRCPQCRTPNPRASYLTHCVGCGTPRPASEAPVEAAKPQARPAPRSIRPDPQPPKPDRRRRGLAVASATWAFAVVVLVALALARWLGDHWWLATGILYMPRWAFLIPLPVLGLAAAWARWFRLWTVQAAIALVVAGPLMGLSLPLWQWWNAEPEGTRWRIMTLNTGSGPIDVVGLTWLIEQEGLDLICFQEIQTGFPKALDVYLAENNWHRTADGRIISRFPILQDIGTIQHLYGPKGYLGTNVSRARIEPSPGIEIDIVSAHLPTVRPSLNTLLEGIPTKSQAQLEKRRQNVTRSLGELLPEPGVPLLVGGDLNTPSESPLLDPLRSFLRNAFDHAGWGYGYTTPTEMPWVRIDHVLASHEFAITRAWVGPDLGSDHLPMIAEVVLVER
ncbi:hypothetical protein BH23PLA1_BH23PLA1_16470 [soil metagenome]